MLHNYIKSRTIQQTLRKSECDILSNPLVVYWQTKVFLLAGGGLEPRLGKLASLQ